MRFGISRNEPQSTNDEVRTPRLGNMAVDGYVCTGRDRNDISAPTPEELADAVIAEFWASEFSDDLDTNPIRDEELNELARLSATDPERASRRLRAYGPQPIG